MVVMNHVVVPVESSAVKAVGTCSILILPVNDGRGLIGWQDVVVRVAASRSASVQGQE